MGGTYYDCQKSVVLIITGPCRSEEKPAQRKLLQELAAGEETLPLPGDVSRTVRLLSLPLYLAGQVRRLAMEWCDAPASPTPS